MRRLTPRQWPHLRPVNGCPVPVGAFSMARIGIGPIVVASPNFTNSRPVKGVMALVARVQGCRFKTVACLTALKASTPPRQQR